MSHSNPLNCRKLYAGNSRLLTFRKGTLLAAAVIGCFSWFPQDAEHWVGPAAWYSSLALSLLAVLLSSSEAFIFSTIKNSPNKPDLATELGMILRLSHPYWDEEGINPANLEVGNKITVAEGSGKGPQTNKKPGVSRPVTVDLRWNMIFTWQAPMMLMAYSVIGFLMGLIVYVCTPLYDGTDFDGRSKVCVTSFSDNSFLLLIRTRPLSSFSRSLLLGAGCLCGAHFGHINL